MLLSFVLSLFFTSFPASSQTSWMQPAAFHLRLNMTKSEVARVAKEHGWKLQKGKQPTHQVINFDDRKTVTLMYFNKRLQSIRFEMVDFFPAVKSGFGEQKTLLSKNLGGASTQFSTDTILVFDKKRPNVHVFLTADKTSDMGKQGIGMLVVRYFDPAGGT
jgi:hypothetical protein